LLLDQETASPMSPVLLATGIPSALTFAIAGAAAITNVTATAVPAPNARFFVRTRFAPLIKRLWTPPGPGFKIPLS
jgi:hypothetical protein